MFIKRKIYKMFSMLLVIILLLSYVTIVEDVEVSAATWGHYEYTVSNGVATITKFNEREIRDVVIPETLGGYPVRHIGANAFAHNYYLGNVIMPHILTIGENAFYYCIVLRKVAMRDVIDIGQNAFGNIYDLSLYFGEGIPAADWNLTFPYKLYYTEPYEQYWKWKSTSNYCTKMLYAESLVNDIDISQNYLDSKSTGSELGQASLLDKQLFQQAIDNAKSVANDITKCMELETVQEELKEALDLYKIAVHYEYKIDNQQAIITRYAGQEEIVRVVERIEGYYVTDIEEDAFKNSNATEIILPYSVKNIGTGAFEDCVNLTTIVMPEVTEIDISAFAGCMALESVDMPAISVIGRSAFAGCEALTNIYLQDVLEIGINAFRNCENLEAVYLGNGVPLLSTNAFTNTHPNFKLYYSKQYETEWLSQTIPYETELYAKALWEEIESAQELYDLVRIESIIINVQSFKEEIDNAKRVAGDIARYAQKQELEETSQQLRETIDSIHAMFVADYEYEIIDNEAIITGYVGQGGTVNVISKIERCPVTIIGEDAFKNNSNIIEIVLPNSATSIERSAFEDCNNLTSIVMPEVTEIDISAFAGCESLKNIDMPKISSIGRSAFAGCTELNNIYLQDVLEIEVNAFRNCENLEVVYLGNGVPLLGTNAFTNTHPNFKLYYLKQYETEWLSQTIPYETELYAKALWEEIESAQELYDSVLTNEVIPERVKQNLTEYISFATVVANDIKRYSELNQVSQELYNKVEILSSYFITDYIYEVINEKAIINQYIGNDVIVNIPNFIGGYPVNELGEGAFEFMNNIIEVNLPNSVKIIGMFAFSDCTGLTSINMPGVVTIDSNAFEYCSNLVNVNMKNIQTVKSRAFQYCTNLTGINLYETTAINNSAFYGCSKLTAAYFKGNSPTFGTSVFNNTHSTFKVYYLSDYEASWSGFTLYSKAIY